MDEPSGNDAAPCQCHSNFAYIAPTHGGHCCFHPPTQTCHAAEVAVWKVEYRRIHGTAISED